MASIAPSSFQYRILQWTLLKLSLRELDESWKLMVMLIAGLNCIHLGAKPTGNFSNNFKFKNYFYRFSICSAWQADLADSVSHRLGLNFRVSKIRIWLDSFRVRKFSCPSWAFRHHSSQTFNLKAQWSAWKITSSCVGQFDIVKSTQLDASFSALELPDLLSDVLSIQ